MPRTKRYKMNPKLIYVVTIKEVFDTHEETIGVEAFRSRNAAIVWINKEMSDKIDMFDLSDGCVDGWCVEIGGPSHTIQYDVKECMLN